MTKVENRAIELLKEAAGSILTEIEIVDSGRIVCECEKCKILHKIQHFLIKNDIEWTKK